MHTQLDPANATKSPVDNQRSFTILIVDDDQDCRALMRDAIHELAGPFRVIEHENGKDAVDFLLGCDASSRPDVVFLDLEMPRMGGLETLETIKGHPRMKDIPVVILTGVADGAVIERAALLGANSYTVKPNRVDQFIQTILASANYWLNVHQYPKRQQVRDST